MALPNAGITAVGQDKAEQLQQLLDAALAPSTVALTVVSGTAQQDTTGLPSEVYVAVTGGSGGTIAVAIGPTATVAAAIIPASNATLNQTIDFTLPAGWFFKVTVVAAAAIASAVQVTGL
jgi:hypothetical protein